jgi:DNA-binding response OmpR family regulator
VEPKVLVIANDIDVRNHLVRSLSGSGLRVFAVPDIVILEVAPRGVDRWETLQRVREMSFVPLIALVSLEDREGRSESLDRGADSCLTKPFYISELQARVRALLRRVHFIARSARQAPATPVYSNQSL